LDGLLEIVGRKSSNGIEMITIPTDSMSPTINKGDVVFIDTTINYYNNEGVYIFVIDDEVYIKRLQKIPGGIYRALSDNKTY
ncbi:helix-turn-helix transcriptional regulator, partial [Mannheimia haemolytica]